MTSTVRVQAHNYPVMVTAVDQYVDGDGDPVETRTVLAVLQEGDGERTFHCHLTRTIECVDLEHDDPRVPLKTNMVS